MILYYVTSMLGFDVLYYAWDNNGYAISSIVVRDGFLPFKEWLQSIESKEFSSLDELKGYARAISE